jgi:uncharacterized protein YjiS (DUF1127 family)
MTNHLQRQAPIDQADISDRAPAIRLLGRDDYIARDHVFDLEARPRRLLETLGLWRRRYLTRRQLRQLDRRGLADIGIDAVQRDREASKPFWKL